MSRASKRKKIQRAKSPMGNMPSYNASNIQQQVAALLAKAQSGPNNILYSPGIPLQTQPGVNPDGVPRQWSFPLAINTSGVDRSMGMVDIPSFKQLRMLAKLYSGITLPERVWLDMVHGLKLTIGLRPELKAQGMNDSDTDIQKSISKILTFFEKPDKNHDLHSWIKMMIRDQTQIDEMYLYKRRTRGGGLYALEVVAGDYIKPLLDDWGRPPEPPLGSCQQFPWGIPGDIYTSDEMIHYQETPQSDTPYGFGRVERFMMEVNQALRKKKRDLAMFTEGNIPTGIMEVPAESVWTPDQIEAYEQLWNALIAGNVQQQVRIKFTQPGMKYVPTDKGDILTDFDYFLYKISCGVYGISLADIGFVEDIHKSSDQGQQNMMYRRTLFPIVSVYAHNIITNIIRTEFHDDRLIASFTGYEEEEDFNTQAAGFQILTSIGAIAPSDVAHKMGLPDVPKTGPFILGKDGPIFLIDYEEGSQMRTLQQQSQVAGLQFAAQNPGGAPPLQGKEEKDDTTGSPKGDKAGKEGSQTQAKGDTREDEGDGDAGKRSGDKSATSRAIDSEHQLFDRSDDAHQLSGRVHDQRDKDNAHDLRSSEHPTDDHTSGNGERIDGTSIPEASNEKGRGRQADESNRRAELKRWRICALHDMERGRSARSFESSVISSTERDNISRDLERCKTPDDIKAVFREVQERDASPKLEAAESGGLLMKSKINWRSVQLT